MKERTAMEKTQLQQELGGFLRRAVYQDAPIVKSGYAKKDLNKFPCEVIHTRKSNPLMCAVVAPDFPEFRAQPAYLDFVFVVRTADQTPSFLVRKIWRMHMSIEQAIRFWTAITTARVLLTYWSGFTDRIAVRVPISVHRRPAMLLTHLAGAEAKQVALASKEVVRKVSTGSVSVRSYYIPDIGYEAAASRRAVRTLKRDDKTLPLPGFDPDAQGKLLWPKGGGKLGGTELESESSRKKIEPTTQVDNLSIDDLLTLLEDRCLKQREKQIIHERQVTGAAQATLRIRRYLAHGDTSVSIILNVSNRRAKTQ